MFKIGKRVYKTAIAVALCLLIYLLLMLLEMFLHIDNKENTLAPTNWYTPFFAGIATVYAMQQNPEGSIRQAKIRSIGSIIGGLFGAVVIFIFEKIYLSITHETNIHVFDNDILYRTILFIITALGIIFLIPLSVKLKKQQAVFIACLTYLSVTISIRNGGMEVFLFATNRILSTIIGVLISLMINSFPFIKTQNKNILFVSSLQGALLDKEQTLSPYCSYKINDLIIKGCPLSFMTTKALTSVGETFENIKLKYPVIIMNGCALYYPNRNEYKSLQELELSSRKEIEQIFNSFKVNYFSYLINNNKLCCYYLSLDDEGSNSFYRNRNNNCHYSFVEAIAPSNLKICQYVLIDKKEKIEQIIQKLNQISSNINIVTYPYSSLEGYQFLKINPSSANKENALEEIKKEYQNLNYQICVGSGRTDIEAMKKSDFSICLNNAPEYIKEHANYVIPSEKPDDLMRLIYNVYKQRDFKKYLGQLNKKK